MRSWILAMMLCLLVASPTLACGPPALGVSIDAELPKAKLTQIDLAEVKNRRAQISDLAAAGNVRDARELEEQAMKILGYKKASEALRGHLLQV
jgi:hypothetical protein